MALTQADEILLEISYISLVQQAFKGIWFIPLPG